MRATTIGLLAAVAASASAADTSTECSKSLHMIIARGTGEDKGPGATAKLAEEVVERIPGSNFEGLDYPATLADPDYDESVAEGDEALRKRLREYVKECPDSKIAVLGYSQGAHVSSDVFCGGPGGDFGNADPLPTDFVEKNVVAIVLFGDPSHVANATYNKGTSKKDGIFERDDISACETLGDRVVSYCDTGDVYCDSGADRAVHSLYLERYGDDVVKFIVDQYESAEDNKGAETTASRPTPSSSGAGSTPSATTGTDTPSTTTGGEEGAATETGDNEDAAAGLVPGLGLAGMLALGVIALM